MVMFGDLGILVGAGGVFFFGIEASKQTKREIGVGK